MPIQDALRLADTANLQLVEVNPNANPPVCKIMDYGKYKYETAKRDRDSKKNKKTQEVKEVKFRPKIGAHDFEFKVKHARRFLEEGDKVRLSVQFRGRELVHPETGRSILQRVCKLLEDVATIHQAPQLEGNRMGMVLNPKPGMRLKPKTPTTPVVDASAAAKSAPGSAAIAPPSAESGDDDDLDDDDDDDDDGDEDADSENGEIGAGAD
jgi:translation initiation factor IF-3